MPTNCKPEYATFIIDEISAADQTVRFNRTESFDCMASDSLYRCTVGRFLSLP